MKTKVQKLVRQCGVYATAKYLKNRGYTIQQCFDILSVSL